MLTPSVRGAVSLPAALVAGAVVLWKTHVEDIKEEAETITTLALADVGAAARTLSDDRQWVLLLDEFGTVLQGRAGARAVALMQRARSCHGRVLVSTQSVSDIPSATGNEHLLGALTDNFTGFVAHRQTSPESRDWLAKLFGTREIWQSTDRTIGGRVDGAGSRRRAAEFIVRPDEFRQLRPGEAIIASTLGPPPEHVTVTRGPSLQHDRVPSGDPVYRPIHNHPPGALLADVGEAETEAFWTDFLRGLVKRGLLGVQLAVSDAHAGLKAAIAKVLGCAWQRCTVHFLRDCLGHARRDQHGLLAALIRPIFNADSLAQARDRLSEAVAHLDGRLGKIATLLEDAEPDILAFYAFPADHWRKLRSTNPLERFNREIGRRTDVVGIFPDDRSLTRLAGMLCIEANDEWLVGRRYLSAESISLVLAGRDDHTDKEIKEEVPELQAA